MRFAISIPQFVSDGEFDPARFRAYMARAESLGFESAWTLEQTLGAMPFTSPLQTLSYAAACTERIRLGCVVFVTPLHSPVHLAKDLSTLDQLSRGRIEIGIGTGGRHRMFSAFQVDPTSLVARFNEGLRLMKALWTEPRVNFGGRSWQLKDPAMSLSHSRSRIRRSGSAPAIPMRCDARSGTATASSEPGRPRRNSSPSRCRSYGRHSPRRGATPLASRSASASTSPSTMTPSARAGESASRCNRFYPFFELSGLEAVAVYGPPDACVQGLRDVAEAGAELILLNPVFDEAEQMERLVAEVVPKLS